MNGIKLRVAMDEPDLSKIPMPEAKLGFGKVGHKARLVPNGHPGEEEPELPAQPTPIAVKKVKFDGNLICLGLGSVWECAFPMLVKHLSLDLKKVTLIDMLDRTDVIREWLDKGAIFERIDVTRETFQKTMEQFCHEGDILLNLAYDVDVIDELHYCADHKVIYLNTSIEEWDNVLSSDKTAYEKSLYARRQQVDEYTGHFKNTTTAILEMGANPGMISIFLKQGLLDLAKAKKKKFSGDFAELARDIGVKVALDTERDTQIVIKAREVGEFVGTWSCLGLLEEATSPAELGWGTHELEVPKDATVPTKGPKNQIFLHQMGMNTRVRGFVPCDPKRPCIDIGEPHTSNTSSGFDTGEGEGQQINGVLIRHGEAYSISHFLTTKDGKYRPTVYYCYTPCDATVASLQELRANDYKELPHQRIAYENDILEGADTLGIMLGGYDDKHVWWCGSSLNIDDARKLAPLQNATSIQVACGVVAGLMYAIENPNLGVIDPEDIPHDYVLNISKPYLGTFISKEFDWTPQKFATNYFPERKDLEQNKKDLWCFQNFIDNQ
jgi:homospermidine synthase